VATLVVTRDTTPDGVVEATGGWFAPQGDGADVTDQLDAVREHTTGRSVLLVGRRTSGEVRGLAHRDRRRHLPLRGHAAGPPAGVSLSARRRRAGRRS
jgi:hypothetical protein